MLLLLFRGSQRNVLNLTSIIYYVCRLFLTETFCQQVDDSLERHCEWCGHIADLINCRSCEKRFCASCIKRNIGEEYLSEVQSSGWDCCCCSPIPLQRLTLELEKAMGDKKSMESSSDSSFDSSSVDTDADVNVAVR